MNAPAAAAPLTAEGSSPTRTAFFPLTVVAVEPLTSDSVAVSLTVPAGLSDRFAFTPGQHLTLRLPADAAAQYGATGEVRRTYSICSTPSGGRLRVAIRSVDGGVFSRWALERMRPGDVVEAMPPAGRFTLVPDPAVARRLVLVAAGSGITPLLAIAQAVLETERASEVTLFYGNRTATSVMFADELADLKDRFPARFAVHHVLSRDPGAGDPADLFHGRIDRGRFARLVDALAPPERVDAWYLCGPLGLVDDARAELAARGVDPARVHAELFFVDGPPPARRPVPGRAAASEVTCRLGGQATTVELDDEAETILEALLRQRADAPFACKGGVCGTCRARLVEGEVAMDRDYALEAGERAAGFVLTCQSHPTSARVVVDYDA